MSDPWLIVETVSHGVEVITLGPVTSRGVEIRHVSSDVQDSPEPFGQVRRIFSVDLDELPELGWQPDSDERFQWVERNAIRFGEELDRMQAKRTGRVEAKPTPLVVSDPFFRARAFDPKAPGVRLRVEREPYELTQLAEEEVLPERVKKVAHRILERHALTWLTAEQVHWLHGVLGELIVELDVEGSAFRSPALPEPPTGGMGTRGKL